MNKTLLTLTALLCAQAFSFAAIGTVVVGTSETQVLPARNDRNSLVITNPATNANTIYLKYDGSGTAVTIANGIPLAPGERFVITATFSANPARNRITAISTGSTTISFSEDDAR